MTWLKAAPFLVIVALMGYCAYSRQEIKTLGVEMDATKGQLKFNVEMVKTLTERLQESQKAVADRDKKADLEAAQRRKDQRLIANLRGALSNPESPDEQDLCLDAAVPADLDRLLHDRFPGDGFTPGGSPGPDAPTPAGVGG